MKRKTHTQQSVIEAIRQRSINKQPLSTDIMNRTNGALFGAGVRLFGTWVAALEASDIDPESVRKERVTRNRWSKEKIIGTIQQHAEAGHDLAAHRLSAIDAPLVSIAPRYFGSWDKALQAAGLDPDQIRLTQTWTPQRVMTRIRDLQQQGADLSDQTASAYDSALYGAATTHYGSWRQAVESAGVDYREVKRIREDWTVETMLAELRKMQQNGIAVSNGVRYMGALTAVKRLFGSLDACIQQVGVVEEPVEPPIVNRLREHREAADLSKSELGRMVAKSHTAIRLYETGELVPSLATALQLAAALKTSVDRIWIQTTKGARNECNL